MFNWYVYRDCPTRRGCGFDGDVRKCLWFLFKQEEDSRGCERMQRVNSVRCLDVSRSVEGILGNPCCMSGHIHTGWPCPRYRVARKCDLASPTLRRQSSLE